MISLNQNKQALFHSISDSGEDSEKYPYPVFGRWIQACLVALILSLLITLGHAATDTGIDNDNRYAGPFPIGFSFEFYGQTFTEFYVSENGLLQFSGQNLTNYASLACIPSSHSYAIYALWSDTTVVNPFGGDIWGGVHYETQGQTPNGRLIVQWSYLWPSGGMDGSPVSAQAILYESKNQIRLSYKDLWGNESGERFVVGLQGQGVQANQLFCDQTNQATQYSSYIFSTAGGSSYVNETEDREAFTDITGLMTQPVFFGAASAFTNQAPVWSMPDQGPSINAYEIDVRDEQGDSVARQTVNDYSPFEYTAGLEHGKAFQARIRVSANGGDTWTIWSDWSEPVTVDTVPPEASLLGIENLPSGSVKVFYAASDDLSGVENVHLQVASDPDFISMILYRDMSAEASEYTVTGLPQSGYLYFRLKAVDSAGNESAFTETMVTTLEPPPAPPVITAPQDGAVFRQPEIVITGTAEANARIQGELVYNIEGMQAFDGEADASGNFSIPVTLRSEGSFVLTAAAENDYHMGEACDPIRFRYELPVPVVAFIAPAEGAVLSEDTLINLSATDEIGIASVTIYVNGSELATLDQAPYQYHWDVSTVDNGSYVISVRADNTSGKSDMADRQVNVQVTLAAPVISSPVNGATLNEPSLTVSGTAETGTQVQLYLDGAASGSPVAVDSSGSFSATLTLPAEGSYSLTAEARKNRAVSARSQAVNVVYELPTTTVGFVTPAENAVLTAATAIEIAASDTAGIAKVDLFAGDVLLATLTEVPYQSTWDISTVENGPYTLKAVATSTAGRTAEALRSVTVEKAAVPQPPAAPVIIVPAQGATVHQSSLDVAGTAEAGSQVQLYLDGFSVGAVIQTGVDGNFSTTLIVVNPGRHVLAAYASNAAGTGPMSLPVGFAYEPSVSVVFIAPLADEMLTEATLIEIEATETISAIESVALYVDDNLLATLTEAPYQTLWDVSAAGDGAHTLKAVAVNTLGQRAEAMLNVTVAHEPVTPQPPVAPTLINPVNGATLRDAALNISGTAEAGAAVQCYLDGNPLGAAVTADAAGRFSVTATLPAEGTFVLTADASNAIGTGALSAAVSFRFEHTLPTVTFASPAENATLSTETEVEVIAADAVGLASVELFADDVSLGLFTEAPYQVRWNAGSAGNGAHTLKAVATNLHGQRAQAVRTVNVEVMTETPVPQSAYTGHIDAIHPAVSYGPQPVSISGRAIDRTTLAPVPNAVLKLVLTVNGFNRFINIVSDSAGSFDYHFIPQDNDSGTYSVSVIHPDEEGTVVQDSFAVNRIRFSFDSYNLTAARNTPAEIAVKAKPSNGAEKLRWVALPDDQPSGSLPQGITIDGGSGIDIAAGVNAPMTIRFTAAGSIGETGTVILAALAEDSGDFVRGRLTVNYRLIEANPGLHVTPTYIETGLQQGESISESVTLGNRGLVAAENVRVQLLDQQGNSPPGWIFLASAASLGKVNVGDNLPLQITAMPDDTVTDGTYQMRLHVSADNDSGGSIPVSVSVMQGGQGGVRFDVADIYTATLGADGQPIPGVSGAKIKLQNEAVLTETHSLTTGTDGIAMADGLPPGVYLYRVSAPDHTDTAGRVRIRPGVVTNEHVFLDYQIINIEFSVTETTIQDVYDIVLEATFNTLVPAPVVLLEPLSISLSGMQAGEEKTGQLTLTNYGFIQAEGVEFRPPASDANFRYEFFADIPESLPPKTRITIPYRITALTTSTTGSLQLRGDTETERSLAQLFKTADNNCSSYTAGYFVRYHYICPNGDESKGKNGGVFHRVTGTRCTPGTVTGNGAGGSGGGDWGGVVWAGSGTPLSTVECVSDCKQGQCCGQAGALGPMPGGMDGAMGGMGNMGGIGGLGGGMGAIGGGALGGMGSGLGSGFGGMLRR